MDLLTRNDLNVLMQECRGRCVSIFMPSHRTGDTQQDPIRFKNLLKKAEEVLVGSGQKGAEARALLDPANRLLKKVFFKEHQSDGFALFISPGTFRYFWLPVAFPELVVVNERFYVKPLLTLFAPGGKFYLLALSQDGARLFLGTRFSLEEMRLHDIPDSLRTAIRYDIYERWPMVQGTAKSNAIQGYHGVRGIKGTQGVQGYSSVVTGHGYGTDDRDAEIYRYFRQIDRGMHRFLGGETAPLVLAGVEYLMPLYRDANTYPHLVEETITGNPEGLRDDELHRKAWAVVEPYLERSQSIALARYRRLAGEGSALASNDITLILLAAWGGRVDTLFISSDRQIWGTFDTVKAAASVHKTEEPGDEDLIDRASVYALRHSGKVYPLDSRQMPDSSPVAALFRY